MNKTFLTNRFVLNEHEIAQILDTPSKKIKQSNTFNDLQLTKEERIAHASSILKSNKWK